MKDEENDLPMAHSQTHEKATPGDRIDRVPAPENGGHSRSHAAHLGHPERENTKPFASMQPSVNGELREPPMVTSRVGKDHRKQ